MIDLHVAEAGVDDAASVLDVVHTAFRARPVLDPPGTALEETIRTVEAALAKYGGLLARVDGQPAGAMLFQEMVTDDGTWLGLRRVSVHPHFQRRGVATAMVGCAEEVAAYRELVGVRLQARAELPETVEFWWRRGYAEVERQGPELFFAKALPLTLEIPTPAVMHALGVRLAQVLRAGDLVVLTGELGAGKTTLTQGIAEGLGVREGVTSPTFVIARAHPSLGAGPPLVHVDAYRLQGVGELDDLDLDTEIDQAVTVVEWGSGIAEGLAEDRIEVMLTRAVGEGAAGDGGDEEAPGGSVSMPAGVRDTDVREVGITPVGRRWTTGSLRSILASAWPELG